MDERQKKLAEELLSGGRQDNSFIRSLFFGRFPFDEIFPYPDQTVDEEFLARVKEFADNEIDPELIDREMAIPESVKEGLNRLGVMGMTVPKEYGGLGMSQTAYCRVTEILAARCASTALFVNVHQSIGLKALLLFGTDEQKARYLPKMASGEIIGAFALTESNAGSDAAGVETRAEFDPERNSYRLTGRKQWITNGGIAGVLTVMAVTRVNTRAGIEDKITAFLVTPDMPGFKVQVHALEKVGYRGTHTAILEFDNMEVPAANILGEKGKGLKVALSVLDYGRTTFGASCLGSARFLLDKAVRHAKTRYQFGRPLGSFSLVKEKLSKMASLVYAMEAATYTTAGLIDRGAEDIMLESAALKVFASDALWQILYDTMQIYGGRSLFVDMPLERMMRDARLNMIGEGSNEVLRAFIGVVGSRDVGLSLKEAFNSPSGASIGIWIKAALSLVGQFAAPKIPVKSPKIAKEAQMVARAVKRLGFSLLRCLIRYRENVVERQLDLNRLARSAEQLYMASACLAKLDRDLMAIQEGQRPFGTDVFIGRFFCHRALEDVRANLDALFDPEDRYIEKVSDIVTGL